MCGNCYAFAAVAAIESKMLIQYDKKYDDYQIDLSEQQLTDCATQAEGSYESRGCGGGYLEDPLAYAARWAGVGLPPCNLCPRCPVPLWLCPTFRTRLTADLQAVCHQRRSVSLHQRRRGSVRRLRQRAHRRS